MPKKPVNNQRARTRPQQKPPQVVTAYAIHQTRLRGAERFIGRTVWIPAGGEVVVTRKDIWIADAPAWGAQYKRFLGWVRPDELTDVKPEAPAPEEPAPESEG